VQQHLPPENGFDDCPSKRRKRRRNGSSQEIGRASRVLYTCRALFVPKGLCQSQKGMFLAFTCSNPSPPRLLGFPSVKRFIAGHITHLNTHLFSRPPPWMLPRAYSLAARGAWTSVSKVIALHSFRALPMAEKNRRQKQLAFSEQRLRRSCPMETGHV